MEHSESTPKPAPKQKPVHLPKELSVNVLKEYNSPALYLVFGSSIFFMLAAVVCYAIYRLTSDGHSDYDRDYPYAFAIFYICGNATIVFRMVGVRFLTEVVHVAMHIAVIVLQVFAYFDHHTVDEEYDFFLQFHYPQYILFGAYCMQFLAAFPLVYFGPTTTDYYDPIKIWLHDHTGILTFSIVSWNFIMQLNILCIRDNHERATTESNILPVLAMTFTSLYILSILLILLVPTFNYTVRSKMDVSLKEKRQTLIGSRHRLV